MSSIEGTTSIEQRYLWGGMKLSMASWLGGSVVERRSLTSELSLVCTGPAADG